MNLFRTRKLFGIDQLTRIHHPHVSRMSTTPPASSPPPSTLSANHPEPVFHPRIIFRSEHIATNYVRSSIVFHLSCITIDCYVCLVFIVSYHPPPLSVCPV